MPNQQKGFSVMKRAALKTYFPVILTSGVIFISGCATLSIAELDDAIPQGAGNMSVGGGFTVPSARKQENTEARLKRIVIAEQFTHVSALANIRYGVSDFTDISGTIIGTGYPGFGFRVGIKNSFTVSSTVNIALFGSAYYLFTLNEEPYWEDYRITYNRKYSGLTTGGVVTLKFPRIDIAKGGYINSISVGAKITPNYVDAQWTYSDINPNYFPNPGPEFDPRRMTNYFYIVTPYAVLSTRTQKQVFYLEVQSPYTNYNNFKTKSVQNWQVTAGLMFKIIDVKE